MAVPYTFGSATAAIPLSQLDSNFATTITLGNTPIQLGNTVTTLNNMTLANVTISSGSVTLTSASVANANVTSTLTLDGGTANGVAYLNASKVLTTDPTKLSFDASGNLALGTNINKVTELSGSGNGLTIGGATAPCIGIWDTSDASYLLTLGQVDTASYILNKANGALILGTNNAEKARIDSSGRFYVYGSTNTVVNTNGGFYVDPLAGSSYTTTSHVSGTASGNAYSYFFYNNAAIGSITQNGTTGVLYNLTSDYRLKNNPVPVTGAKEFIMALQPKKWQWWDGSGEGVGFIAHEFMEVAKYSGNGEKDAVDKNGKPVYQSIQPSSSEVMANLVALIQEQQALITTLTERITALEGAK